MKKQLCTIALLSSLLFLPIDIEAEEEGIDVSEWQGSINFNEVRKAGISSVYIKATEGFDYYDPYYRTNYENAKANGMNVGFYHYLTAQNSEEAYEQANFFVSAISGLNVEMKFALDYEQFYNLDKNTISDIALTFMNRVSELTNKECVLYASAYYANNNFNEEVNQYALWVAEWGVSTPSLSGAWDTYAGWQYSDKGLVQGISTYVDRDLFQTDIFLEESFVVPDYTHSASNTNDTITIRVESGDTLWGIAREYHTTVASIVSLNNIANPNLIYPGQQLTIYQIQKRNSYIAPASSTSYYRVQAGDTLSEIALRFHTSVDQLVKLNNIANPNFIYVGQVLLLTNTQTPSTSTFTYTIVYGDTLSEIALRYGTSVQTLAFINAISNPNIIYAGESIQIPFVQ
ncbi:MAG: LysM peptidoglycan-binding domain-containing protein [Erysipelotrichia bacterium]|nr:LysM peptidoglycan-binding domain-containing protein [Erysipelotrichia bacterium]NCC54542.1 LysM peptidoglycan-binding domain-containing protein [Erysipelotrichia bacterium]